MPFPKNLFTPTTGVKEKVKCHLCNKMYRFDYLRNVHFPKEHKQPYKRPADRGQVSISLFQKHPKDDTDLGAVGVEDVTMSEPVMSDVDDTFNLQSPCPHSSFELRHKEIDPRPESAPPSVRHPVTDQTEINYKILAEIQEIKTALKNVSLNDSCNENKSDTEMKEDELEELRLKGSRSIEEICSTSNIFGNNRGWRLYCL